jgi:SAM-dependent methyltransferase
MNERGRTVWETAHVVDVRDATFAARTYLEHRELRRLLLAILGSRRVDSACELGSGFGRMTPVLTEFADTVSGFEREPHFVAEAHSLFPDISFHQVATLESLPAPDHHFALVLTFTVLQHLTDAVLQGVAREMHRVLRPGGMLVMCEETDTSHVDGSVGDPNGMCTIGRSVSSYRALFPGYVLRATRPRIIEPTYPRPDVGTFIVLERPREARETANARFAITTWDEKPYREGQDSPKLARASVTKTYSGDITGEGQVEYLMMYRSDGSAAFVGLERVEGRLGGKTGSFVLQRTGTFEDGLAKESYSVVPGSATGELLGLRGEGRSAVGHGTEHPFSLDYELDA